jgi:hypothetical protein
MSTTTITINRAPVLTLWAAVVAERLGFDRDEALSLAKAVAGLNAQAKGRRLGIFKPHEERAAKARKKAPNEGFLVEVCGRAVPAVNTGDGIRATRTGRAIDPASVQSYLERAFGEHLPAVRTAMTRLAKSYRPAELANAAFGLYEQFRPAIPEGVRGWGAKGELDLADIRGLAKRKP